MGDVQDDYAAHARAGLSPTEVAGRYRSQSRDERRVVRDVLTKLDLGPDDDLLEVGCGPGTTLIPLAFCCRSATGVDHAEVLDVVDRRFAGPPEITLRPGDFMNLEFDQEYDAVLVYSVVQVLADLPAVLAFVEKAARLLRPGGRLLLGDLANADKRRRFHESPAGRAFQADWEAQQRREGPQADVPRTADTIGAFTDDHLAEILLRFRSLGFEAFLLPQPEDLPFGRTREDILVRAQR